MPGGEKGELCEAQSGLIALKCILLSLEYGSNERLFILCKVCEDCGDEIRVGGEAIY